jgi:Spy/CpxP family protein refolding chaperone
MKGLSMILASAVLSLAAGTSLAAEPAGTLGQPAPDGPVGKLRELPEPWHEGGPGRHESYGDVVLRHADDLKLSDEQIGKIVRIHQDNQRKIKDIGRRLRETRNSAYALFLNPGSDEAAIRKAAKDHTAAFDELVETALKTRAAINAILTPDQSNQLKSFKAEPPSP